jgi:hypothetical protein
MIEKVGAVDTWIRRGNRFSMRCEAVCIELKGVCITAVDPAVSGSG